jgi:glucose uptake protein GlcU
MDTDEQLKYRFEAAKLVASLSTGTILVGAALLDKFAAGDWHIGAAITCVFLSLILSIYYIYCMSETSKSTDKDNGAFSNVLAAAFGAFLTGIGGMAWFVFVHLYITNIPPK